MGADLSDQEEYENCLLSLKLSVGSYMGEPSHYVTAYAGVVLSGEDYDQRAGEMSLHVADLQGALANGHAPWEVLDSVDAGLAHFCSLISARTQKFVPSVARIADSDLDGLLVLGHLEIQPAFRGRGLGLMAIEAACRRLSIGCSIAVLKAFPTQWEGRIDENPAQFRRDRAKLMKYYGRADFEPLLSDGLMARRLY